MADRARRRPGGIAASFGLTARLCGGLGSAVNGVLRLLASGKASPLVRFASMNSTQTMVRQHSPRVLRSLAAARTR